MITISRYLTARFLALAERELAQRRAGWRLLGIFPGEPVGIGVSVGAGGMHLGLRQPQAGFAAFVEFAAERRPFIVSSLMATPRRVIRPTRSAQ